MDRGKIGNQGENRALKFLRSKGLKLRERNYRWKHGEIDLIMQDGNAIVFVEVRFRRNQSFGGAGASINAAKQHRLLLTAERYLQSLGQEYMARMDVITLDGDQINWIQNAFESC
jgi:putative endonuclease